MPLRTNEFLKLIDEKRENLKSRRRRGCVPFDDHNAPHDEMRRYWSDFSPWHAVLWDLSKFLSRDDRISLRLAAALIFNSRGDIERHSQSALKAHDTGRGDRIYVGAALGRASDNTMLALHLVGTLRDMNIAVRAEEKCQTQKSRIWFRRFVHRRFWVRPSPTFAAAQRKRESNSPMTYPTGLGAASHDFQQTHRRSGTRRPLRPGPAWFCHHNADGRNRSECQA